MIELALAVGAVAAVPVAGELAARRYRLCGEVARKLVHAGSGIVAASLPLLVSYRQIAGIALGFAAVMIIVHRFSLLAALNGIERRSSGEVWFPLGVAALAIFFPHAGAYVYGTLVLGLADAIAAVVGIRIGGWRLPLARSKTVWGSAAFCATTLLIGVAVYGGFSLEIVSAAAALTVAEALASRGTDNIVIPVFAGLLATQGWA